MIDYQIWASIAIILQALFTFALVYLTYQYTQATKRYTIATDKQLKITGLVVRSSFTDHLFSYFEKRLEKLFLPIRNNQKLFEYLPNSFNEFEAMGINNFVNEIKPYTHLAEANKKERFPALPLLRTVLAIFTAYGSSIP